MENNDLLFELWQATGRYADPKSLSRFDARVYSQNGEDGIIAEIFRRIGTTNRHFVEIGVGDGLQNNTRLLLEQGWRGVWIEGSAEAAAQARKTFASFITSGHLNIVQAILTCENINAMFAQLGLPEKIDFLSLDVDQNTSHIWRELNIWARVSCIEYNASLPASIACEVPYEPLGVWDYTNWYGASLKTLELLGQQKNAALVGCEIAGVNAFFVDTNESTGLFQSPFTAEQHFEPPRYYRTHRNNGHRPATVARRWIS